MRTKPYYDKHRRIRKRIVIDGTKHGLPVIKRTWGQVFSAKQYGKKMAARMNRLCQPSIEQEVR